MLSIFLPPKKVYALCFPVCHKYFLFGDCFYKCPICTLESWLYNGKWVTFVCWFSGLYSGQPTFVPILWCYDEWWFHYFSSSDWHILILTSNIFCIHFSRCQIILLFLVCKNTYITGGKIYFMNNSDWTNYVTGAPVFMLWKWMLLQGVFLLGISLSSLMLEKLFFRAMLITSGSQARIWNSLLLTCQHLSLYLPRQLLTCWVWSSM